ncbi:alpha-amylase-like [Pomacea canaliculata]|uniref:alpha-amylase-like n=1 Tax=Pomacea canaliculata TaxID=400727 RepID=UPI000D730619|nr:alpha-amylase-like [Pomacea canaliculata]
MFGTKQDLLDLIRDCHQRDIWVMMDVVANHMGIAPGDPEDLSGFVPFNESWHYHTHCLIQDFMNQTEVELCRLFNLMDLNQTEPWVRRTLLNWIADITREYGFDGYRIDTAVEVEKSFWSEFWASSGVFMLGEANNGDRTCYTGGYQGPLPSVLNFPLYWAMRRAFNERQPMTEISKSLEAQAACFSDLTVLGLFADNHDFPRFLNLSYDTTLLSNAITYVLFGEGIPLFTTAQSRNTTAATTPTAENPSGQTTTLTLRCTSSSAP